MNRMTLKIDGMSCGHCVTSVTKEVRKLDGVTDVDLASGTVQVTSDTPPDETDLRSAVRAGIEAFAEAYATGEPREGATAFLDKRAPRFTGN